jgi:cardiolipin synthase
VLDVLMVFVTAVLAVLSVVTATHALLHKRDPRAALGWIAVSLLLPLIGPLLYTLFGFNRIRRRARSLDHRRPRMQSLHPEQHVLSGEELEGPEIPAAFTELARISGAVTHRPLLRGNEVHFLRNGEEAFPPMLEAIARARRSVCLATYIFETDRTGLDFIDALARAAARGVDVRVLVDGIGALYSRPRAPKLLRRRGVRTAMFLPPRLLPPAIHVNLRNHRKILVTDGDLAFTGGMNIGGRHLARDPANRMPTADLHFRLAGPIVRQIEDVFLSDWSFATGDELPDERGARPEMHGSALCRTIVDGPDEEPSKLAAVLVGAVSAARRRIALMTPYFLPPREIVAALEAAALRGVEVTIVLPERSNLPFVHWATRNMLWEVLQRGARVFYQPPPFSHTKLYLVDDHYLQIGSANLDPRSLRLNFELMVEIYGREAGALGAAYFHDIRQRSREVTLEEVDSRPFPERFRDSVAWLFQPYL